MGYLDFCFVFLVILVFPTETFCDLQEHFCFTSRISTQSVLAECLILGPVISKYFGGGGGVGAVCGL